MIKRKKDLKGFLKALKEFVCAMFGLDNLKEYLDKNGLLDSLNDFGKNIGIKRSDGSGLISTKKEKENKEKAAEEARKAQNLQYMKTIADNSEKTREAIEKLISKP